MKGIIVAVLLTLAGCAGINSDFGTPSHATDPGGQVGTW